MKIAVASGKGGTGKTTIAVNLALARGDVDLLDCDVEDPDVRLFLPPPRGGGGELALEVEVPAVDERACTHCGDCARGCAFNAIVVLPGKWLLMPELCKDCGGCYRICPEDALRPARRRIGSLSRWERDGGIRVVSAALDPGEAMATPLIERVKEELREGRDAIIDAPPGAACAVVHAIASCDLCLLVAEPTPFGLHDLEQTLEVAAALGLPRAVVINRCDLGGTDLSEVCRRFGAPVLLELPFDRGLAEAYARGQPAVLADERWLEVFRDLWGAIARNVEQRRLCAAPDGAME